MFIRLNKFSAQLLLKTAIALLACAGTALAQTSTTFSSGHTPPGVAPGNPNGNYPLSDLDSVNLFNGNVNIVLPLTTVGGRGSAGFAPTIKIQSYQWQVREFYQDNGANGEGTPNPPTIWRTAEPGYQQSNPSYQPGTLIGTRATDYYIQDYSCNNPSTPQDGKLLTRLKFLTPDGTEIWLHDQLYGGQAMPYQWCGSHMLTNRKRVFISSNGEAITFVSDTDIIDDPGFGPQTIFYPSGYLFLKNGTRYRIVNGIVTAIRDRNGNYVERNPTNSNQWIDSLKRKVTFTPTTQSNGFDLIEYTGFAGLNNGTRQVKVHYNQLMYILRPDFSIKTGGDLFPRIYMYGSNPYPYHMATWEHNPASFIARLTVL